MTFKVFSGTSKNIPDESTIRKNYVDDIYKKNLTEIYAQVFNCKIWIASDDTTYVDSRYLAYFIVIIFNFEKPG